jgi:AcrR family transcriptional regulator
MGRPATRSIRVKTPERLLDAAEAEFALRGLEGARLSDIAARAGITRPSLLHHFETKEALYQATVEHAFARLAEVLMSAMSAEANFVARVEAVVEGFGSFMESSQDLARLLVREVVERDGPGRAMLLERAVPLLDEVERFVVREGRLDQTVPVRAVLMMVVSDVLMKVAAGEELRGALWGSADGVIAVLRAVILTPHDRVAPGASLAGSA